MAATTVLHSTTPEGITTITINRPEVRNAVNRATATALAAAFRAFDADPAQKVCILTGAGSTFCAGYDLHEVAAAAKQTGHVPAPVGPVVASGPASNGPMGPTRLALSKPVIAAISGHAVAGGLELALLADLRVADSSAVLGVFCRRFGVPLIDGGTVRLPRVVGLGRALDLILTGRAVGAAEALAMGLLTRVVPAAAEAGTTTISSSSSPALEEARRLARSLLAFPQDCMRADRAAAYYGAYEAPSLHDALRYEFEHGSKLLDKESLEGAGRFDRGEGRGGSFPGRTGSSKL